MAKVVFKQFEANNKILDEEIKVLQDQKTLMAKWAGLVNFLFGPQIKAGYKPNRYSPELSKRFKASEVDIEVNRIRERLLADHNIKMVNRHPDFSKEVRFDADCRGTVYIEVNPFHRVTVGIENFSYKKHPLDF